MPLMPQPVLDPPAQRQYAILPVSLSLLGWVCLLQELPQEPHTTLVVKGENLLLVVMFLRTHSRWRYFCSSVQQSFIAVDFQV